MKNYDTFIIGELCIDEVVGFDGTSEWSIGGAVVYSSYSALAGGNRVGILIKSSAKDKMMPYILPVHNDDIYWRESASGTSSIRNVFLDEKRERRTTTALAQGSQITAAEIPDDVQAKVFHLAGLMNGDYENAIIPMLAKRGKVALDMQCYLRTPDRVSGEMVYGDWPYKKEFFPYITYLKTDAAEAEILTGTSDRREAARLMVEWGVKEALITHNTEVLVYDGRDEAMEDDWRIGVIERYLDNKACGDTVCIKELKCEALFPDSNFQCDLSPKESQEISQIMSKLSDWERIGRIYTTNYGRQRCWRKKSASLTSECELPF